MRSPFFHAEHDRLRRELSEFFAAEVAPHADEWERDRCAPRSFWLEMGRRGWLGLHYPEAVGGGGKDIFHSVVLLEELGRTGYAGLRAAVGVHAYMATAYLARAGSDALKRRYLAPAIRGEKIGALALTEADAGTDVGRLATTATPDGAHYVVNGRKKFIVNGTSSDFLTLAARTGPVTKRGMGGLSFIVVDADSKGITRRPLDNLGWHSSDTAEIVLEDVRVPAENVIGAPNEGFVHMMQCFQLERLVAGLLAIGGTDRCLDITWRYLTGRKVFDGALSKFQAIRHRMADLMSEAAAVRQLAHHAAWLYEHDELPIAECSMVKLRATELAKRAAQECIQLHGAHGYQSDSEIARMYRDVQAATLAAGASEMLRDVVAQATLDDEGWRRRFLR